MKATKSGNLLKIAKIIEIDQIKIKTKIIELQFGFREHQTSPNSLIYSWRVEEEKLLNPGSGLCSSLDVRFPMVAFLSTG